MGTPMGIPLIDPDLVAKGADLTAATGGDPLTLTSVDGIEEPADSTYYTYPPRLRPPEKRQRIVVRNIGTKPFQIAYGTSTITDFASPSSGTFATTPTVQPGFEWVGGDDPRAIFARPVTSGDPLRAEVEVQIGAAV